MLQRVHGRGSARICGLALAVLVWSLVAAQGASAEDIGNHYACSASTVVAVGALTNGAPTCNVDLVCFGGCRYAARAEANGAGLVGVTMRVLRKREHVFTEWRFHRDELVADTSNEPPSCSGAFQCTAPPPDRVAEIVIGSGGTEVVTVGCFAPDSLALTESISCSFTSVGHNQPF
jgi:hypothetical protein